MNQQYKEKAYFCIKNILDEQELDVLKTVLCEFHESSLAA